MNNRNKIYYPDSQIQKNLYTQGREWMTLEDWQEYRGPYHRYITGETFSGAEWNAKTSKKLVRFRQRSETFFEYIDNKNYVKTADGSKIPIISGNSFNVSRYRAPRAVKRVATDKDLTKGYMVRYFVYKRNEPNRVFFEISEEQSKTYNTTQSGINHNLYNMLDFKWKLDGPEYDVYENGMLITPGVFDTNKRIVLRHSKKFTKLADIITNFFEYTVYEK